MEGKNGKMSLSMLLLIIAIIIIAVMGIFLFKINNEKTEANNKAAELQAKATNLNETVYNLQGKLNTISETISSNTVTNNKNKEEKATSNNATTNQTDSTHKEQQKETVKDKIIGKWKAEKVLDSKGNDLGLGTIWGTGISYSNEMEFKENGVFAYRIGITPGNNDDGAFTVKGNTVKYSNVIDEEGLSEWNVLTYVPEENILKEEKELIDEKVTVIYTKIN